jgi:hypothetical protein
VLFLRTGATFSEHAMVPSGKRLRVTVSAVMRKAGQPHVLDNGSSVVKKRRGIRANPRLLTVVSPDTTRPYVEMSPEPEGKTICYIFNNLHFKSTTLHAFTLINSRHDSAYPYSEFFTEMNNI